VPEPEQKLPDVSPSGWPEQLSPEQEVLKDLSLTLSGLLDAVIHGNPSVSLEGFTKSFLDKYHERIPQSTLDEIYDKRHDLMRKNSQDPSIRR
jgi:hypothetical protein